MPKSRLRDAERDCTHAVNLINKLWGWEASLRTPLLADACEFLERAKAIIAKEAEAHERLAKK
jgi:hypothetical protein